MKQLRFEVKSHNNLRSELAKIKRYINSGFSKPFVFRIYTKLVNMEEIKAITDIIEEECPDGFYYGCQTFGNIQNGKVSEYDTLILCTIFEYESTQAKVFYIDPMDSDSEYQSLQDVWDFCNVNDWVKVVELTPSYKGSAILGLGKKVGNLREDVQVVGGVAANSQDVMEEDTYIWTKGRMPSSTAAIAVAMGGPDLHVLTDSVLGWEGLGKTFKITSCDGRVVHTIDNEPAMNIYRKYLDIEQDENFLVNAMAFPLIIRHNGQECVRVPSPVDNKDEFGILVDAENGMEVKLSYGERNTIIRHVKNKVKEYAKFAPELIGIYSCASRLMFWGDNVDMETEIFENISSSFGFYTMGELIRNKDKLNYYNSTMVVCLVREGEAVDYSFNIDESLGEVQGEAGLAPKLVKYIGQVSGELQNRFNSTMRGLANIYESMFLIKLDEDELIQMDENEWTTKLLGEKDNLSDKFRNFLRYIVVNDMLYDAMIFCDVNTLRQRLRDKDVITMEINGKDLGWFRAQFAVIGRDALGVANQLVFTTQIIDAEKKAVEEQQKIVNAIADSYFTIHLFNLVKDEATEVTTQEIVHKIYQETDGWSNQDRLNMAFNSATVPEYLEYMLDFVDLSTLEDRLKDRDYITTEFKGYVGWAKITWFVVERNNKGKLIKVLLATQIIEEEKRREEGLIRNAITDELTGMFNRRAYEMDYKDTEENGISSNDFIVVAIDVNGLKAVNDTLGHEAGDEMIIAAGECIKRCFGAYGKTYRVGGDEFAAFIYASPSQIKRMVADLEASALEWTGLHNTELSVSCGYACIRDNPGERMSQLVKIADRNMYAAKEFYYRTKGKNRRSKDEAYVLMLNSYAKILKINLTDDSYSIIKVNDKELSARKGYEEGSISKWLHNFAITGQVHESDVEKYMERTSLEYLRKYFAEGNTEYLMSFRRKVDDDYKNVIMEIIPSHEFEADNQVLFLYIKIIQEN